MEEHRLEHWREAILGTEILRMPQRSLSTFGPTNLTYYCLSQISARQTRVRRGVVSAQKPKIILAEQIKEMFDGLGDEAKDFAHHMIEQFGPHLRALGYRFGHELEQTKTYRKTLRETYRVLLPKIEEQGHSGVIAGPEEFWQISVIKLALDMAMKSFRANATELEERGFFNPEQRVKAAAERLFAQCEGRRLSVKTLGDFLMKNQLFQDYEDRFFNLVKTKGQ